ncbi:MAG: hypothetical protein KGL65_10475, partial [Rhodospirillales bacterium]|nr:hypothetical protein [Rhodospirillales bacterium]
MSSRTLVLSPDLLPDDEFALLNKLQDVQCLIIEQGPEAGYRTTLPGRLHIPGEILIRPGASLEVSGDLKAGHIYGQERATMYIAGDLSVKSIQVNPGRTETSIRKGDKFPIPGIVVGGYLRCEGAIRSVEGSISARAI